MRNRFSIGAFRRNQTDLYNGDRNAQQNPRQNNGLGHFDPLNDISEEKSHIANQDKHNSGEISNIQQKRFNDYPMANQNSIDDISSCQEIRDQKNYIADRENSTNILVYIFVILMVAILTVNFQVATQNVDFSDLSPINFLSHSKVFKTKIAHQRSQIFSNSKLSSTFDNGNMLSAKQTSPYYYEINVGKDPINGYQKWFYFCISRIDKPVTLTFVIKNLVFEKNSIQKHGLFPVYKNRETGMRFQKMDDGKIRLKHKKNGRIHLKFSYTYDPASHGKVYFAQTFPWSFKEGQDYYEKLIETYYQNPRIYQHKDTIIKSHQKAPIDVIWVASPKFLKSFESWDEVNLDFYKNIKRSKHLDGLFPNDYNKPQARVARFLDTTKVVVISNRFHGYESQSCHVLKEFISYLLSDKKSAVNILDEYVFVIFPMINPDGVSNGYSISSQISDDLEFTKNLKDDKIVKEKFPGLFALDRLIDHIKEQYRFQSYFEFRAPMLNRGSTILSQSINKSNFNNMLTFPYVYSSYQSDFVVKKQFIPGSLRGLSDFLYNKSPQKEFYQIYFSAMKNFKTKIERDRKLKWDDRRKTLLISSSSVLGNHQGINYATKNS